MGFSLMSFTGLRFSNPNLPNLPFLNEIHIQIPNLHFPKQKQRAQSGMRPLLCKHEAMYIEERRSPNEVTVSSHTMIYPTYRLCVIDHEQQIPQVKEEIQKCYALVSRLGRGVVYLGSSRIGQHHPHYVQTLELGREIANLLDCTTWTGAGPGLMDAATRGALQAKKPVGGLKIVREAKEWTTSNFHPYLPPETYLTCRFFSARKHGFVDAAVRSTALDRTAVIALPGGIGTLDEMFEILALIQLERIGSKLPVPFILMNYDSFYSKLLEFLDDCEGWGTVSEGEVASLWKVCDGNSNALEYLAELYEIPQSKEEMLGLGKTA